MLAFPFSRVILPKIKLIIILQEHVYLIEKINIFNMIVFFFFLKQFEKRKKRDDSYAFIRMWIFYKTCKIALSVFAGIDCESSLHFTEI